MMQDVRCGIIIKRRCMDNRDMIYAMMIMIGSFMYVMI